METEYSKKRKQKRKEILLNKLKKDNCILLSEYKNKRTSVMVVHTDCGNIFYDNSSCIISRFSTCPFCYRNPRAVSSGKQFKDYVDKIEGYTLLSEYIDSKKKVKMKHEECGTVFSISPNKFKSKGQRCPNCIISLGEEKVKEFLDSKNIFYYREKTLEDMLSIGKLRFDFYLPEENIAIEFNGGQHYKSIEFFGGDEEFKNIQRRDTDKKKYCVENNITYIEVPFNQKDVIVYLENQFKLYRNNT
ncbi:hypothetical protein [Staphylococcus phage PT94]